ncbi:MAG: 6-bladed beta-propeller, partial [Anaerolineales bacterium]
VLTFFLSMETDMCTRKRLLIVFVLIFTACLAEREPKSESGDPSLVSSIASWADSHTVVTKELLKIGTEDLDSDHYMFAGVNDLRIDDENNVYILDRKNSIIEKYAPDGAYMKSFQLKRGQGPGEFQNPLFFDIGIDNHLYISDNFQGRITVLDQEGTPVKIITSKIQPSTIAAGSDGSVFVTGGVLETGDHRVFKYSIHDGELEAVFCRNRRLTEQFVKIGGSGELCRDRNGNIYYAFYAPYDIRKFTPQGELIARFAREASFVKPPSNVDTGLIHTSVFTKSLVTFPDGKLLYVICDRAKDPSVSYFDVFDTSGNWLISFTSIQHFPDWVGRLVRIDGEGNFYLEFWEPFPHVRKYSVEFTIK